MFFREVVVLVELRELMGSVRFCKFILLVYCFRVIIVFVLKFSLFFAVRFFKFIFVCTVRMVLFDGIVIGW